LNDNSISPEVNAKIKKNLIWITIFAVIMIFAGLTSGYIVSQGAKFWVNIKLPSGFFLSTVAIFVSSGFLILAKFAVKRENSKLLKGALGLALFAGIMFGYYQFKGFGQLFASGNAWTGKIMTLEGRYGKYYSLMYEGKRIIYDGREYSWKGEPISEQMNQEMMTLGTEIMADARSKGHEYKFSNYGEKFMLLYEDAPVTYSNNSLQLDGEPISAEHHRVLWYFGENLANERGDFIMQGTYGEDFWVYFKGEQLEYENREFYRDGLPLSPKLRSDIFAQDNQASSYIYAFTIVHLLHWVGGIIALLVMFIRGLHDKYHKTNYLGITIGSIYWHFLGILWLYLYAFLIFIH